MPALTRHRPGIVPGEFIMAALSRPAAIPSSQAMASAGAGAPTRRGPDDATCLFAGAAGQPSCGIDRVDLTLNQLAASGDGETAASSPQAKLTNRQPQRDARPHQRAGRAQRLATVMKLHRLSS